MARPTPTPALHDDTLEQAAKVLKVLAHPQRLRMVEMLGREAISVGELAQRLDLAPAAVSQHLNRMEAHGILAGERVNRQVIYRVVNPNARFLIECLTRHGDGRPPRNSSRTPRPRNGAKPAAGSSS